MLSIMRLDQDLMNECVDVFSQSENESIEIQMCFPHVEPGLVSNHYQIRIICSCGKLSDSYFLLLAKLLPSDAKAVVFRQREGADAKDTCDEKPLSRAVPGK